MCMAPHIDAECEYSVTCDLCGGWSWGGINIIHGRLTISIIVFSKVEVAGFVLYNTNHSLSENIIR